MNTDIIKFYINKLKLKLKKYQLNIDSIFFENILIKLF